ncbi:hypothetical protein T4B_5799 [Trichinella pseudospiralis]|uniref:Uncharacterized protein n=1 Tax=Trichinella pseudospiralis TaxID=6337 RepID=A0A0V1ESZ8_TRIPS|nr:hypothetical protein T4A_5321 [Trichinella pseudospiralis]KRZ07450.1 hypothetical protein T4B_5799 [Trichinella pseudospiralis]KRZ41679.1 hypothetical protein T4C_2098 [Trichinella pseudospiralis]
MKQDAPQTLQKGQIKATELSVSWRSIALIMSARPHQYDTEQKQLNFSVLHGRHGSTNLCV